MAAKGEAKPILALKKIIINFEIISKGGAGRSAVLSLKKKKKKWLELHIYSEIEIQLSVHPDKARLFGR